MIEENDKQFTRGELLVMTDNVFIDDGGFDPDPPRLLAKGQVVSFWSYETWIDDDIREIAVQNLSGTEFCFVYTKQVKRIEN